MNWLLLRGLVREQRHWGRFRSVFEREVPGAKTFCLDLPGVGTECRRSSPSSIEGILGDLRPRWEQLRRDHEGPWGLLSISLGAMIAMRWVELYPHDFDRLVVINSSAADLSWPHRRLNWRQLPGVLKSAILRDRAEREKAILGMTTALLGESINQMATEWGQYAVESPVSRSTALKQLAAAVRFVAPQSIRIPVLVLSSQNDAFTDPRCSERLAAHLEAPWHVHPRAGHDITLDDPEWISMQVASWMRG